MSRLRLQDWRVDARAATAPAGIGSLLAESARVSRRRRARVAGTLGLFALVILTGALLGLRRAESQDRTDMAWMLDYHLESLRPGAR